MIDDDEVEEILDENVRLGRCLAEAEAELVSVRAHATRRFAQAKAVALRYRAEARRVADQRDAALAQNVKLARLLEVAEAELGRIP